MSKIWADLWAFFLSKRDSSLTIPGIYKHSNIVQDGQRQRKENYLEHLTSQAHTDEAQLGLHSLVVFESCLQVKIQTVKLVSI